MTLAKITADTKSTVFIDPPSGWKWGFPKEAPDNLRSMTEDEFHAWLVSSGYPSTEIEYWKGSRGGIPCRFFTN